MNHCRFLNRQAPNNLKPGANKRMETVFRPFVCGDPRRDHALVQELGTSLGTARGECKRRCPAKFGLPAAAPEAKEPDQS